MTPLKSLLPRKRHLWSAALLAAAFTSAHGVAATQVSDFDAGVRLQAVTPFLALSSARIEGVAEVVGPVSPDLKARLDALSAEADEALRAPGAERLVTLVQLERAYLSGVEDATTYVYGEAELARMLDGVTAMVPQITSEANGIHENLKKAGVFETKADQLAVLSVSAGARSSFDDKTLWMNAISSMAAVSQPESRAAGLEETSLALIEGIALHGMLRVGDMAEVALLKGHNVQKDREWTMIQAEVFQASQEAGNAP